jgi:hypothetical protein
MTVATTSTQVTNNAWTLIGAGPLALQAEEGEIFIEVAASTPSTLSTGLVLRPEDGRVDFDTTSNIYAMSADVSGSGTVVSAPMTA